MVGRPHGHDGDGLRSAARAAHHGGRGDDAGGQGACLVDESALDESEPLRLEADGESAAERDAGCLDIALRRPESERLRTGGAGQELRHRRGRAVFDLGTTSATLVSATPGSGWSMQVWKTESWIRVEFTSGADRVSVFCTWHDGPPRVEIGTY